MVGPCPLQKASHLTPHAPALSAPEATISFGELNRSVTGTAARLRSHGIEQGSHVAMCVDNSMDAVILILAVIRAGGIACPITTRLPDGSVAERVRTLKASLFVSDRTREGAETLEGLLDRSDAAVEPIGYDRRATIIFTSGSSGSARPAVHTFGNHIFSALGSNGNIPLGRGDRWLLSLPMYHVGGLAILFRCLVAGAEIVVPGAEDGLAKALRSGVSHVSLVATQLRRLLREEDLDVGTLKGVLLGGSAIPAQLVVDAHRRGWPVHISYGLTEMASQVATTPPGPTIEDLQTAGYVLPHREVRVDRNRRIHTRGRTRFEGYLTPSGIERPFDANGWFETGDLGRFDEEGRLIVLGRADNLFISGGENVLPESIEEALTSVKEVKRAIVVPVADAEFGQRPVAFVDVERMDEQRLRAAVEEVLPGFMVPDAFFPWPDGLKEVGIKIDRHAFQRHAETLAGSRQSDL